jgi:glycosyltransferase involved in cell wall biosynthesis
MKKIVLTHRHFPNFDLYKFKNDFEQRNDIIGFVGRLEEDKGVLNFVKAIPKVATLHADLKFLIIGEGTLKDEICAFIDKHALNTRVELVGWVAHDKLPDYLTSLKLLVLPSYAEGLPNIVVEAMACGTPVLVTPVGAVPDIVKDKETGFLIHDNSSACLAQSIDETLAYPHLKQIAANARIFAESEFQYEKLAQTWKGIISGVKKTTC